jgi:methylated-DNA-[protein]-cysteine S-methyltransferase
MMSYSTLDTPAGPFTYLVSEAGAVRASGFTTDVTLLLELVHPALREDVVLTPDAGGVGEVVQSYLDGDLGALDAVPVEQRTGGPFLAHAWTVMRDIKPGSPMNYS